MAPQTLDPDDSPHKPSIPMTVLSSQHKASTQDPMAALMGIVALAAAACGVSSNTSSSTASAAGSSAAGSSSAAGGSSAAAGGGGGASEPVIWADNSANTAKAIEPLCLKWAADTGVTCTVNKFNGGRRSEKGAHCGQQHR